jgi:type I restriction enzyme, S subunit
MRPRDRWLTVPLGTLAEFRNGVNYNKSNFGTGIKVIGVSDFQDHVRASFDQLEQINPEGVVRKEHLLRDGDILFVRSNGNRDLIGRSLFVSGLRENVTHSAFSIRLRFTSSQCCPRFYAYLFRSTLIRQALSMFGGGTNITNLNQGILERLQVPVPPIAIQDRTASVLSAYDDLIENNTRRIKILEEMAQMLFREWFVNFRFPGHEKVRMVESELGPIPEGWEVRRLGDVARVNEQSIRNSSPPDEIHYIDIASVSTARIEKKEPMRFADAPGRARRIVRHGDTIWSTVRPNRRSYALILNPEPNLIVSTGFAVLTAATAPYSYLYFAATTDEFADYLTNHATGSAYPAVNGKDFENAKMVVPPESLANRFHKVAAPMLDLSWCLHQRNINLRTTRDLLLPKLISGKIWVDDDAELMVQTA